MSKKIILGIVIFLLPCFYFSVHSETKTQTKQEIQKKSVKKLQDISRDVLVHNVIPYLGTQKDIKRFMMTCKDFSCAVDDFIETFFSAGFKSRNDIEPEVFTSLIEILFYKRDSFFQKLFKTKNELLKHLKGPCKPKHKELIAQIVTVLKGVLTAQEYIKEGEYSHRQLTRIIETIAKEIKTLIKGNLFLNFFEALMTIHPIINHIPEYLSIDWEREYSKSYNILLFRLKEYKSVYLECFMHGQKELWCTVSLLLLKKIYEEKNYFTNNKQVEKVVMQSWQSIPTTKHLPPPTRRKWFSSMLLAAAQVNNLELVNFIIKNQKGILNLDSLHEYDFDLALNEGIKNPYVVKQLLNHTSLKAKKEVFKYAVDKDYIKSVKILISHVPQKTINYAFIIAAQECTIETFFFLTDYIKDIHIFEKALLKGTSKKRDANFTYYVADYVPEKKEDRLKIIKFLDEKVTNISVKEKALENAVQANNKKIVAYFIKKYGKNISDQTKAKVKKLLATSNAYTKIKKMEMLPLL